MECESDLSLEVWVMSVECVRCVSARFSQSLDFVIVLVKWVGMVLRQLTRQRVLVAQGSVEVVPARLQLLVLQTAVGALAYLEVDV